MRDYTSRVVNVMLLILHEVKTECLDFADLTVVFNIEYLSLDPVNEEHGHSKVNIGTNQNHQKCMYTSVHNIVGCVRMRADWRSTDRCCCS